MVIFMVVIYFFLFIYFIRWYSIRFYGSAGETGAGNHIVIPNVEVWKQNLPEGGRILTPRGQIGQFARRFPS